MKKMFLVFALLFGMTSLYAQEGRYGKFDFELGFGIPVLAVSHPGKTNVMIPSVHLEGRWQLQSLPIDVGFHLGLSVVKRIFNRDYEHYRAIPMLVIGDYQFGRGTKFNPYAGIGIGISGNTIVNYLGENMHNFALSPRIGVRCFKFLNASMGYLTTQKDYSRLYFNLGFYF